MKMEFPNKKTIIIITGSPGTGKSGTTNRFLKYINNSEIIQLSYDLVKEKNWDSFGYDSIEQKNRLNNWSLEEFYLTIQKYMWENRTIVIEYAFYQFHKQKLEDLICFYDYSVITIFLYTDMETAYKRVMRRDHKEKRHPGHLLNKYHIETFSPDMLNIKSIKLPTFKEFTATISHKEYNINLGFNIIINVTDFSKINYEDIYKKIIDYQKQFE